MRWAAATGSPLERSPKGQRAWAAKAAGGPSRPASPATPSHRSETRPTARPAAKMWTPASATRSGRAQSPSSMRRRRSSRGSAT
eukprot:10099540-Alexandrium_andersonii.AAC.1